MTDFLPKDPVKALVDVKEELYDRLRVLRSCIQSTDEGIIDPFDIQMMNEIYFLENLLDKIERS